MSGGPNRADLIRRSAAYLAAHGVESPLASTEALLMRILGTDRAGLYRGSDGLDTATAKLFGRALCQRCRGVPLQYLTGEQQFMDLSLSVSPGVFVPRPETEVLVDVALSTVEGLSDPPVVVDVGTGTGAVGLAIKHHRPDAVVWATDVSEAAVTMARANGVRLGLDVDVRLGDLLDPLPPHLVGRVDLLVSNPPYVTEEEYEDLPQEVKIEPLEALVGGTGVHRRLVDAASRWLAPGRWLVVEIGAAQGREVTALAQEGLVDVEVLPDLAGRDRVVRGRRPMAALPEPSA
jgi:release factor glutamine methyltransferase